MPWIRPNRQSAAVIQPDDSRDPYGAPLATDVLKILSSVRAQEPSAGRRATGNAEAGLSRLPNGNRNNTITSLAGWARNQGLNVRSVSTLVNGFNEAFFKEPLPSNELRSVLHQVGRWEVGEQTFELDLDDEPAEGETRPAILKSSLMTMPPPMPWLWKPWLPEGRLVLLVGDEGIGKGMFSASCAVRAVSGDFGEQMGVMWFSMEDDPEEDIYKRLIAAAYKPDVHEDVHFFNPDLAVGFPANIPEVETYIVTNGIKLVIVDPGRSYLSGEEGIEKSFNNDVFVGTALRAINRMAARTGSTILFIHHTNKNADASRRHRSSGSAAFSQAARHRIDVAKVGTDVWAEWAMAVTKTNYGVEGYLTEYRLVASPEHDTAYFEMGEELKAYRNLDQWAKSRSVALDKPVEIVDD
jgi:hypothetical protein